MQQLLKDLERTQQSLLPYFDLSEADSSKKNSVSPSLRVLKSQHLDSFLAQLTLSPLDSPNISINLSQRY